MLPAWVGEFSAVATGVGVAGGVLTYLFKPRLQTWVRQAVSAEIGQLPTLQAAVDKLRFSIEQCTGSIERLTHEVDEIRLDSQNMRDRISRLEGRLFAAAEE